MLGHDYKRFMYTDVLSQNTVYLSGMLPYRRVHTFCRSPPTLNYSTDELYSGFQIALTQTSTSTMLFPS